LPTQPSALYRNPAQPIAARVNDLLSQMTLAEKIAQTMNDAPAIGRLDVPQYNWWNEALHGLGRAGLATVFPQSIGLAATWNPALMHQVATVISDEARAKYNRALQLGMRRTYTGLTFWSPNINIFRDPRWGRGQETYGEDPYLTAALGVAFVKGLQGDDPHYLKLVATPKHFAVHSGPEPTRHTFNAQVSESELRDFYLFAFEACVVEGQAVSLMGAYNRVNGEACCASHTLLQTILRDDWDFDGYVVSDCNAITDIFADHKIVDSPAQAAALAIKEGCDLECGSVYQALSDALDQNLLTESDLDKALARTFTARFRLGMFDPADQVPFNQITPDPARHSALALQAARESIILLKNENSLLPLRKDISSIAVIGPNANDPVVLLGNYSGTPAQSLTPLQAIQQKVSTSTQVHYAFGCGLAGEMPPMEVIPAAYLHPQANTSEIGLSGAYYAGAKFEGQPLLQRIDSPIDFLWGDTSPLHQQWGETFSVRWQGYLVPPAAGTYKLGVYGYSGYRLFIDGKLIVQGNFVDFPLRKVAEVTLEAGQAYPITLEAWNEGLDPQVQLLWALPNIDYTAQALEAARQAEVVVMVMGLSNSLEGEEMPDYEKVSGFAGGDRTTLELPQVQEDLLKQIQALGKPVVLVLMNGSALAINWANEHVGAIVEAWYPGQAGGEALADVLFGDYNPGGKLPVTFYKSVEDLPPFDDYHLEGHTYRYFKGEALFPFGYGLSFTTFKLDHLQVDKQVLDIQDSCTVQLEVTNTGSLAGDEVVQLYLSDPVASVTQPIKRLIGFQRTHLAVGETQVVAFQVQAIQFAFHNQAGAFLLEPGLIHLMVGTSSSDLPLTTQIEITGSEPTLVKRNGFFSHVAVRKT